MGKEHRPTLVRPQGKPSMTDFARAVAEGVVGAKDRFGNAIQRGCMVTYRAVEADPVFEVVDVAPILDPRQPNMVKITISTIIPLRVPINQPVQTLMVVGMVPKASEQEKIAEATNTATPPTPEGATGPSLITLTDAADTPADETVDLHLTDGDAPPEPVVPEDPDEAPEPPAPHDQ